MKRWTIAALLGSAGAGQVACDNEGTEPEGEVCRGEPVPFELADQSSEARFVAGLALAQGARGTASVVGLFTVDDPSPPTERVALVISGADTFGTLAPRGFTQKFEANASETQRQVILYRLDDADVAISGEVSIEGEAVDGCSVSLELVQ